MARRPHQTHAGVLVACVLMLTLNSGLGFYALATIVFYQVGEMGMPLGAASLGASGFMLGEGVGGILVARLARRYHIHQIILVGGLLASAHLAMIGWVSSPILAVAVFTSYGLAASTFHQVPASILMIRMFQHPMRPIAFVMIGLSAGGCVVTPLLSVAAHLIGLANACVGAALILAVVLVATTLYLQHHSRCDGVWKADSADPVEELPMGARIDCVALAGVCVALGLLLFTCVGATAHLAVLSNERGIHHATAAIAGMSGMALLGRLLMIPGFRQWRLTQVTVGLGVLGLISMVILLGSFNLPTLILASIIIGLVSGNYTSLVPMWTLTIVGRERFGSFFARASVITMLLAALGPGSLAVLHSQLGNYTEAISVLAFVAALATVALLASGWRHAHRI